MRTVERVVLAPQVLRRARIGNTLHLVAAILQAAPAAVVVALLLMLAQRGPNAAGALWLCAALALSVALRLLVLNGANRRCFLFGYEVGARLRQQLLQQFLRVPLGWVAQRDGGQLSSLLVEDVVRIEHAPTFAWPQLISHVAMAALLLGAVLFVDWRLGLVAMVCCALALPVALLASRQLESLGRQRGEAYAEAASVLTEFVHGAAVLRAFNVAPTWWNGRIDPSLERLAGAYRSTTCRVVPLLVLIVTAAEAALAVSLAAGVLLLPAGLIDPPALMLALFLLLCVFQPVVLALDQIRTLQLARGSMQRVHAVLDTPHLPVAAEPPVPAGDALRFEQVCWQREGRDVLCDVSFEVASGSLTAIVGPSGAGKTSLMQLIARFHDPSSGRITLGGVDLREIDPEVLMGRLSSVFQQAHLFNDSVAANVLLGVKQPADAPAHAERLDRVARAASS